jgi:SAM-dependent methyltransferase
MNNQKKHQLQYTRDEFGREILLKDGSLQVMMEWEKPYMEACINAIQPSGDVLEIGFGFGYSATQIQRYQPKSHTIIECDPTVIEKAQEWAKNYPNVKIIQGYWQDQLKNLGLFDTIFFDDYTPFDAEEVEEIESKIKKLQKVEEDLQILQEELKKTLLNALNQNNSNKKEQSSEVSRETKNVNKEENTSDSRASSDRLIIFFQLCLDHHMHHGARMSSYIDFAQFKKQKHEFQRLIASRSDVNYTMKTIPIEVPLNCQYYAGNEALVLTIYKK